MKRVSGERGAVLILVAVFALVSVVFLAFVVDIGNQRQDRRQLTTGTDAAALDVAQEWANISLSSTIGPEIGAGRYNCSSKAAAVARANNENVDPVGLGCTAELRGNYGVVTVVADDGVDYAFAGATGVSRGDTSSRTSVRVRALADGLRPLALCTEQDDISAWIAGGAEEGAVFDLAAPKFLDPACGQASGAWGLLDMDGRGASAVAQMMIGGYQDPVQVSEDLFVCDEGDAPESCFEEAQGVKFNSQNMEDAFEFLSGRAKGCEGVPDTAPALGPVFSLPAYAQIDGDSFPIAGFAQAALLCYDTSGADLTSLKLRFYGFDDEGPCCMPNRNNRVLEICDVGTLGGLEGARFAASCAKPTFSAPSVGLDCDVLSITPESQTVLVDTEGQSTEDVVAIVNVADRADCGTVSLRAVTPSPPRSVPASPADSTENSFRFVFERATEFATGNVEFSLIASDDGTDQPERATLTTSAPAPNAPPVADFVAVCDGLTCTFNNVSSDSDGTVVTSLWDFGDGTTSTVADPVKTYATPGSRTVTLTVTDDDGAASMPTEAAVVTTEPAVSVTECTNGGTCTFSVSGGPPSATYSWTYPSGPTVAGNPVNLTFTVPATRNASATYQVTVTVTPGSRTYTTTVHCARNGTSANVSCAKEST